jgi:hypothetical protein
MTGLGAKRGDIVGNRRGMMAVYTQFATSRLSPRNNRTSFNRITLRPPPPFRFVGGSISSNFRHFSHEIDPGKG